MRTARAVNAALYFSVCGLQAGSLPLILLNELTSRLDVEGEGFDPEHALVEAE